jgi:C-methyltransferase C-terminal domain/Putative zinc binding domain/Methyltransferase domain
MSARYTEVQTCRICGNRELDSVFHLGTQHLTGIFPRTAESQSALTQGPLELVKCRVDAQGARCGLLQLRHSFSPPEMYGANYGYRSSLNRSMVEHLQAKVRRITQRVALRAGDLVLDIGSNDGTLLSTYAQPDLKLIGMDPTGEKFRRYYPPHIRLVADFFSAKNFRTVAGEGRAKVVTSIAMFYDLEKPMDFVREVNEILAPEGIWVFEQSYMPAMLRTGSYDTICHEHLEYYALSQIKWMLDQAGMKIVDVELNDVNGGSFSVTAAKAGSALAASDELTSRILADERAAGLDGMKAYDQFKKRAQSHRQELTDFVRGVNARGEKIFGYGASTKGNVILQFCGFTSRDLPCIAEVNEDKFGAFTPGTAIPIVSESEARAGKPDYLLVLPWHFRDNIVQREQAYLRSGGKLVFPLPEIEVVGTGG